MTDEDLEKAQKYIDKMKDIVKVAGGEEGDGETDDDGEGDEGKTDEV